MILLDLDTFSMSSVYPGFRHSGLFHIFINYGIGKALALRHDQFLALLGETAHDPWFNFTFTSEEPPLDRKITLIRYTAALQSTAPNAKVGGMDPPLTSLCTDGRRF